MIFEQKPQQVQATQHDGTWAGINSILTMLSAAGVPAQCNLTIDANGVGMATLTLRNGFQQQAAVGEWVIIKGDSVVILSDAAFQAEYQAVAS